MKKTVIISLLVIVLVFGFISCDADDEVYLKIINENDTLTIKRVSVAGHWEWNNLSIGPGASRTFTISGRDLTEGYGYVTVYWLSNNAVIMNFEEWKIYHTTEPNQGYFGQNVDSYFQEQYAMYIIEQCDHKNISKYFSIGDTVTVTFTNSETLN